MPGEDIHDPSDIPRKILWLEKNGWKKFMIKLFLHFQSRNGGYFNCF